MTEKRVWFDITNTPQVHFLLAIHSCLAKTGGFSFEFSARDFSETKVLLNERIGDSFTVFGGHTGGNIIGKGIGLLKRFAKVYNASIPYDISVSCGSESAIWKSFLKGKRSIAFGDNDQAKQWTYSRFVDFSFFPDAIPTSILTKQGIKKTKLFQYPGYKEDIYIADYIPNPNFIEELPFKEYVVVRPENIMANYLQSGVVKTITPELLKTLTKKGFSVLYLPRYSFDKDYAKGLSNVFIPNKPVNGLDAAYYSIGVLTGAGTFAREAACLGVPSFSFYAGDDLLAVDKKMITHKKMHFSRDPQQLVNKLLKSHRGNGKLGDSVNVRDIVINKLVQVISGM